MWTSLQPACVQNDLLSAPVYAERKSSKTASENASAHFRYQPKPTKIVDKYSCRNFVFASNVFRQYISIDLSRLGK